MSNQTAVEFWFEFASTYSYPAAMRVAAVAKECGVSLSWKPFLLGPIFHAQGWNDSPFNIYPAKGRYMWRDLERICSGLGLPLRRPSRFPRNGLLAARVCCIDPSAPWLPDFVRAVYTANFADDLEISDPAVVTTLLDHLGQPGADLVRRTQDDAVKQRLRAQTEEGQRKDIFGAPSFVVGDELFWGNDRLEAALQKAGC